MLMSTILESGTLVSEYGHMCHCSYGLCCLLILQDDDAVNAEAFINKASFLVSSSQQEVLNLQYKV